MLTWCVVLFLLGVAAALDSVFNYGEIFRRVNAHLFMLVSLGLLVRAAIQKRKFRRQQHTERGREHRAQTDEARAERERTPASIT